MGLLAAARVHDTFTHTSLFAQILKVAASVGTGLLVGLAIGAAAAFIVGTGGVGAVVLTAVVGAVIGVAADAATSALTGVGSLDEYLSDLASEAIDSLIPGDVKGSISTGSQNVFVNGLRAARAAGVVKPPLPPGVEPQSIADLFAPVDDDRVACSNHPSPEGEHMAEGSSTVFINGHPASRIKDKTTCDGTVNTGSKNVSIGGKKVAVREIKSEMPPWLSTIAKYAGLAIAICSAIRGRGPLLSKLACFGMDFAINAIAGEAVNAAAKRLTGGRVGHPVHLPTGAKILDGAEDLDFSLAAPVPVVWQRFYSSLDPRDDGPFGRGWTLPYTVELALWTGDADHPHEWVDPQGRRTPFPALQPGEKTYSRAEALTFACTPGGHWMVERDDGLCIDFGHAGATGQRQTLRPWVMEDRNANRLYLRHDEAGRLVELVTMAGHRLTLTHDKIHPRRISEVVLHLKDEVPLSLVRYAYDEGGRLAGVVDASGETRREFGYDRDGRMIMHRLPGGLRACYRWQRFARTALAHENGLVAEEARVVEHWTDAGERYKFEYDFDAQVTHVEDHLGRRLRCEWNNDYLVTAHTDPLDHTWRFQWSPSRELLSITEPTGAVTRIGYDDERGLPTSVTNALEETTELTWDRLWAELSSRTLPDGRQWRFEYDRAGNLVAEVDPLEQRTEWRLNRAGYPIAQIDARGRISYFGWDARHRLTSRTDCSGNTTHLSNDARGRLTEVRDALGHVTSYGYDDMDRPTWLKYPDGVTQSYQWKTAGLSCFVNGSGHETHFEYDTSGRVITRRNGNGDEVHLAYDAAGNLSRLTNGRGGQYRFSWDAVDRLVEQATPDDVLTISQYDRAGNPVAVRQAAGTEDEVTVTLERDLLGRLRRKRTPSSTTAYRYDNTGRLFRIERHDARGEPVDIIELAYDALDRVVAECTEWSGPTPRRTRLEHGYDELGNRIWLKLPDGRQLDWLYYGSGHVHRITCDGEVVSDFERDALHREVSRTQGALSLKTAWDSRWRRVAQWTGARSHTGSWEQFGRVGDDLAKAFAYDPAGELMARMDPVAGEQRYSYDPTGQLLSTEAPNVGVLNERFAYDAASNLMPGGQAGRIEGNRLVMSGDSRFRYDAHGRMVEKLKGAHTAQRLRWNDEHQLDEVVTTRRDVSQQVRFRYDALGRRVAKEDAFGTTWFVWDGMRLLQEYRGHREATYLYNGHSYEPLARADSVREDGHWLWRAYERGEGRPVDDTERPSARIYHFHTNASGAPEELSDTDGRVVWRTRYRTWGNAVTQEYAAEFVPGRKGEVEKPLPQQLRLQGQYEDAETGLHYNLFRYYDPDIGRFISQDPIGLAGGINLYRYAPNPLTWIDPLGLSCGGVSAKQAGRELDAGAKKVTVSSRSEAEKLFMDRYLEHGYKNMSGESGPSTKNLMDYLTGKPTKNGTYHWDTTMDPKNPGRVMGHGLDNLDGALPHLQIHQLDGDVIHIFFPWGS